jgi:hypothetical protein
LKGLVGSPIVLLANGTVAVHLAKEADFYRSKQPNAKVGNENAGSDIYGISVRIGFIFKALSS